MENFVFWYLLGFFYQYGIVCNVDKNKALELYLLAVNNKKLNECFLTIRMNLC
jgi:TPR repeat protein